MERSKSPSGKIVSSRRRIVEDGRRPGPLTAGQIAPCGPQPRTMLATGDRPTPQNKCFPARRLGSGPTRRSRAVRSRAVTPPSARLRLSSRDDQTSYADCSARTPIRSVTARRHGGHCMRGRCSQSRFERCCRRVDRASTPSRAEQLCRPTVGVATDQCDSSTLRPAGGPRHARLPSDRRGSRPAKCGPCRTHPIWRRRGVRRVGNLNGIRSDDRRRRERDRRRLGLSRRMGGLRHDEPRLHITDRTGLQRAPTGDPQPRAGSRRAPLPRRGSRLDELVWTDRFVDRGAARLASMNLRSTSD